MDPFYGFIVAGPVYVKKGCRQTDLPQVVALRLVPGSVVQLALLLGLGFMSGDAGAISLNVFSDNKRNH